MFQSIDFYEKNNYTLLTNHHQICRNILRKQIVNDLKYVKEISHKCVPISKVLLMFTCVLMSKIDSQSQANLIISFRNF